MRNERGAIGIPGETSRLTNSQAGDLAKWLGYRRVKGTSHGQAIFTNGRNFITQDVDGHIGGTWKMARTPDGFSRQQRLGTYDYELNRIGD
jgi:filamentous hemagglutinin